MRSRRLVVLAALVALVACGGRKVSLEALTNELAKTGAHVQATPTEPSAEWPGAELSADLVVDYDEPYTAIRFPSADLARDFCRSVNMGLRRSQWCIYPRATVPKRETWDKMASSAGP